VSKEILRRGNQLELKMNTLKFHGPSFHHTLAVKMLDVTGHFTSKMAPGEVGV
jgi:hypothetical protein